MGLFKTPKRKEVNIESILNVVENESIPKSKIKLRGTSLLAKLKAIEETVEKNLGDEKDNYSLIQDRDTWLDYCRQAVDDGIVAIDTETAGLGYEEQKQIAGICLFSPSQKPSYAPIGHISNITNKLLSNQITREDATEGIRMLCDAHVKFVFHNSYYDLLVIKLCTGI